MRSVLRLTCLVMVCLFTLSVTAPAEASHSKTKPKRHDCSAYGKVKWTSWRKPAYLYFRNRTQSDINISYIDFGGKKRQWNRQPIKPGKAFYSMTFLTLPWIVETTKGQCLGCLFTHLTLPTKA